MAQENEVAARDWGKYSKEMGGRAAGGEAGRCTESIHLQVSIWYNLRSVHLKKQGHYDPNKQLPDLEYDLGKGLWCDSLCISL